MMDRHLYDGPAPVYLYEYRYVNNALNSHYTIDNLQTFIQEVAPGIGTRQTSTCGLAPQEEDVWMRGASCMQFPFKKARSE